MGREGEPAPLDLGRLRDRPLHADGAGAAGAVAAAVDRARHARVEREPCAQEHDAEVRPLRAFDRVTQN